MHNGHFIEYLILKYKNLLNAVTCSIIISDTVTEITNIVNDTIKTLPNRTREIFYERYLEQKSYKTIAENFGISVKGVEFHVTKSLNVLRKKLKDYL